MVTYKSLFCLRCIILPSSIHWCTGSAVVGSSSVSTRRSSSRASYNCNSRSIHHDRLAFAMKLYTSRHFRGIFNNTNMRFVGPLGNFNCLANKITISANHSTSSSTLKNSIENIGEQKNDLCNLESNYTGTKIWKASALFV